MWVILKTFVLFFSILIIMPIVFFALVVYIGRGFSISAQKNCLIEKMKRNTYDRR